MVLGTKMDSWGRSVSFAFWSKVLWVHSTEETLCKVQQENPQTTVLHFSPHKKRPTFNKAFGSQSVGCDKGYRKASEVSSHGILVPLLPTQVRVSILVGWCRLLRSPFSLICLPSRPPPPSLYKIPFSLLSLVHMFLLLLLGPLDELWLHPLLEFSPLIALVQDQSWK